MNIDQAIKEASSVLKKNHIKSAFLDCEILMSKALNKDRKFIIMNPNEKINDYEYRKFKKLISSRSNNKPIAYIIGKKSFWKYNFNVSEKVLIPRPDTEILIEQVLKDLKKKRALIFWKLGLGLDVLFYQF